MFCCDMAHCTRTTGLAGHLSSLPLVFRNRLRSSAFDAIHPELLLHSERQSKLVDAAGLDTFATHLAPGSACEE